MGSTGPTTTPGKSLASDISLFHKPPLVGRRPMAQRTAARRVIWQWVAKATHRVEGPCGRLRTSTRTSRRFEPRGYRLTNKCNINVAGCLLCKHLASLFGQSTRMPRAANAPRAGPVGLDEAQRPSDRHIPDVDQVSGLRRTRRRRGLHLDRESRRSDLVRRAGNLLDLGMELGDHPPGRNDEHKPGRTHKP